MLTFKQFLAEAASSNGFPKSIEEVEAALEEIKGRIGKYKINSDLTVDVNGNVNLSEFKGQQFPVRFRSVSGDFDCRGSKTLKSLEGSPKHVGGNFNCLECNLPSLVGGPETVVGDYVCSGNKLKTPKGAARVVGGNFHGEENEFVSLEGGPKTVGRGYYIADQKKEEFVEDDVKEFTNVKGSINV